MTALATALQVTADDVLRKPDRNGSELANGQLVERTVSIESSDVATTVGRSIGNEAARTRDTRVFANDLGY